jgi:hypothetical protein
MSVCAAQVAQRFADLLVVAATSFDASAHSVPSKADDLQVVKVKLQRRSILCHPRLFPGRG